jgi:hypothetical protein
MAFHSLNFNLCLRDWGWLEYKLRSMLSRPVRSCIKLIDLLSKHFDKLLSVAGNPYHVQTAQCFKHQPLA